MDPHVTGQLSAYMDGELGPDQRAQVEAHLRGCAGCARHLEELRAVEAAARALPLEVPDGYFEAFPGRVRERLTAARRPRRLVVPVWIGAAAAAVVLAILTPRLLHEPVAPAQDSYASKMERPDLSARPPAAPPTQAPPAAPAIAGLPTAPPPVPEFKDSDDELRLALRRSVPGDAARAQARPAAPAPPPKLAEGARPQPPPATLGAAAGTLARKTDETDRLRDQGYAAGPPADRFEEAPHTRAKAESAPAPEEQKRQDKAAGAFGASREGAAGASEEAEARFQLLAKRKGATAAEARALRDAWRAYLRDEPSGPRADEARVRVVEAGAAAWRAGRDESDRADAEREGREYLARKDARQPHRVRAALDALAR